MGDIWVLLVEVLLKLRELVEVPVFLTQPVTRIPELSSSTAASATSSGAAEAGRTSIAAN